MKKILEIINNHQPCNTAEAADIESFKQALRFFGETMFNRDNLVAHFTSSIWAVNPARTKVLMNYHNLYKSFAWFGGHADGENNPLETAKKEFEEECGIKNYKVLNNGLPIDLNVCRIDGHIKKGKDIPSHLHYNLVYLFEAGEDEQFRIAEGENSAIKWINNNEINKVINEEFIKPVYNRLIQKASIL